MKVKVTVTITREFEINPEWYPPDYSDEQILADEIRNSEELFIEWVDGDGAQYEHKGEIVTEGETV